MGLQKEKLIHNPENEDLEVSDQSISPHNFQTLISAVASSEGLQLPLLRTLHYLLIHLSSNQQRSANYGDHLDDLDMEIGRYGIRVAFKQICKLSSILFKELSKRFNKFFATLSDVSTRSALGQAGLPLDMRIAAETVNLLLRCCMVILNLLVPQQYLLLENGKVLLEILRKLGSLDLVRTQDKDTISFEKSVSHGCTYIDKGCTTSVREDFVASLHFLEPSDPHRPFLCAMLEVIQQLQPYLY
ncbi:unnamed protein product [Ilex paraguariensis]|uniref:DUF7812 domain-containing protein n=2 Tax=Ilex paraguariensis TaxID=185542 RepID=A0ABC8SLY9_9AQUA